MHETDCDTPVSVIVEFLESGFDLVQVWFFEDSDNFAGKALDETGLCAIIGDFNLFWIGVFRIGFQRHSFVDFQNGLIQHIRFMYR